MKLPCSRVILFALALLVVAKGRASAQTWQLVWSDEFNGSISPDWLFDTGAGGWGNHEQQCYQRQNATIENNMLVITARRETAGGANYTSARLKTQGRRSWKYGKIAARISLPSFQGSWPAFWMLGEKVNSAGWPACGELDILEHINTAQTVTGAAHWQNGAAADWTCRTATAINTFHEYAITWDAQFIRWFIDDQQYAQFFIGGNAGGTNVFNEDRFFVLLNLAVGGDWPGANIDDGALPAKMYVDYVRVYQPGAAK